MERNVLLNVFEQLRKCLSAFVSENEWKDFGCGLTEEEYQDFVAKLNKEHQYNPWFTKENYQLSLQGLTHLLEPIKLQLFLNKYAYASKPKTVAIIMAGNIPFVGFHDLICVLFSGNKALVKLSSSDDRIPLHIIEWLFHWCPELKSRIELAVGPIKNYDAVIATGSNNTIHQLQSYFKDVPTLFRKNRTSLAILNGAETDKELQALMNDCFQFFGMGCRNVSKLFLPIGFDLNRIFENSMNYAHLIQHHKYGNNYDYQRTILLMNQVPFLDNNVFMLKEDSGLHAPLSLIYYEFYDSIESVMKQIKAFDNEIQAIVGHHNIPFGMAQSPDIDNFADNIDTINWLNSI